MLEEWKDLTNLRLSEKLLLKGPDLSMSMALTACQVCKGYVILLSKRKGRSPSEWYTPLYDNGGNIHPAQNQRLVVKRQQGETTSQNNPQSIGKKELRVQLPLQWKNASMMILRGPNKN